MPPGINNFYLWIEREINRFDKSLCYRYCHRIILCVVGERFLQKGQGYFYQEKRKKIP